MVGGRCFLRTQQISLGSLRDLRRSSAGVRKFCHRGYRLRLTGCLSGLRGSGPDRATPLRNGIGTSSLFPPRRRSLSGKANRNTNPRKQHFNASSFAVLIRDPSLAQQKSDRTRTPDDSIRIPTCAEITCKFQCRKSKILYAR